MSSRKETMIGRRFGHLMVLCDAGKSADHHQLWLCRCDCNREIVRVGSALLRGKNKSCGCILRAERRLQHGNATSAGETAEYRIWKVAKDRCSNPKRHNFKNYGGRGITMCQEWRQSFATFLRDVGRRPTPRHSLDRIDVNGNYEPRNCRWATPEEQANNKRPRIQKTVTPTVTCSIRKSESI